MSDEAFRMTGAKRAAAPEEVNGFQQRGLAGAIGSCNEIDPRVQFQLSPLKAA